jgi:hypothetical protein
MIRDEPGASPPEVNTAIVCFLSSCGMVYKAVVTLLTFMRGFGFVLLFFVLSGFAETPALNCTSRSYLATGGQKMMTCYMQ